MSESNTKSAEFLETPEKDDLQKYSQTPVSSQRRKSLITMSQNKQASENVKDYFSDSADSRYKNYQRDALDKIRVSLFHSKGQNIEKNSQPLSVKSTSFYGSSNKESRVLPLAPDLLGTMNNKLDRNQSSPSLYDFPNKKITRRKRQGEKITGVSHGVKKLKCKASSIKIKSSEIDDDSVVDKQCESSQKENVGEVENSQNSNKDYNPNKRFFKHKRPAVLQITLGKKPKQKKNEKPNETIVNYSNVFDSLNSKKQFRRNLHSGQHMHSNPEEAQTTFAHDPAISKRDILPKKRQRSLDAKKLLPKRNSVSEQYTNLETEIESEVDESINNEVPTHLDVAMDIENNNFSNNQMMSEVAVHNNEELNKELAVGNNLFSMKNLGTDANTEQNNLEEENSNGSRELNSSSGSKQLQIEFELSDGRNIQCQTCKFIYEFGNESEELAHFDYHSDFCSLQFEGWEAENSLKISDGTDSRIVIIKPLDSESHTKKAFEILRLINKDVDLCEDDLIDNQKTHFFMYIQGTLIVGVVAAEYLEYAFRLESNPSVPYRMLLETTPAKCGINAIWVLKSHRGQGIATKLMDSLRNHFTNKCRIDLNDIAFSIPTPSGRRFAEKYVGSCDLKVF